jgi:hypothetical protein
VDCGWQSGWQTGRTTMIVTPRARKMTVAALLAATVFGAPVSGTALAASSGASARTRAPAVTYAFRTLDNANGRSFNQLLGINNHGKIAGYYGSGARGHPNKGYLLAPPYGQSNYRAEDVPNAAQTQVTGLNSTGVTVGFYATTDKANPAANANFGFWSRNGHFHKVVFPARKAAAGNSSPPVDQLLGINNAGEAVGFYLDAVGNSHGYLYNIGTHRFVPIRLPGAANVTGTGINKQNAVVGFFNQSAGMVKAFYIRAPRAASISLPFPVRTSRRPSASMTTARSSAHTRPVARRSASPGRSRAISARSTTRMARGQQ